MRYLVKGDCGLPSPDLTEERRVARLRGRRNTVRRVIALLCVVLAGFFVLQFFHNAAPSDSVSGIGSPEWDSPSSVLSWLRWNFSNFGRQLRYEIQGAAPGGYLGVILKLACCAVAASVFLRGPNKL